MTNLVKESFIVQKQVYGAIHINSGLLKVPITRSKVDNHISSLTSRSK